APPAGQGAVAGVGALGAGNAAVGAAVAVVPHVDVAVVAQVGGGGRLHFPGEAGDVVAGAGPVGRVGAQRRTGRNIAAVVGDLGVVEPRGAGTDLDVRAGRGLRIAPETAILARVDRVIAGVGCAAGDQHVRAVV